MNGLDLFSGYGGLTLALLPWVRPAAYCEIDRYAQSILLSRMRSGDLPKAPIWDDVSTLAGSNTFKPDIIYGGFPCQDLSAAGRKAGLAGKRSGLFWEIVRLTEECRPTFVFLENVWPMAKGAHETVCAALEGIGYSVRDGILGAVDVGAPHRRNRWFCLAHSYSAGWDGGSREKFKEEGRGQFANGRMLADSLSKGELQRQGAESCERGWIGDGGVEAADLYRAGLEKWKSWDPRQCEAVVGESWPWSVEPNVGRVAHGTPARSHRIKALGNGVVPLQAREAFKRLMLEVRTYEQG